MLLTSKHDQRHQIKEFLSSRRARITPGRAGLPVHGDNRRVPGLRREELAMLAGVSVDYYTRIERGNLKGVSESVLYSIAEVLELDETERAHLFDLARTANESRPAPRRRPSQRRVRPGVQRILDLMPGVPAVVQNGRLDIVATNRLGRALYDPVFAGTVRPANYARFAFLDPAAPDFYGNWEVAADNTVAILRAEAGHNPYDRALSDLIGELSTRSGDFRQRWAAHEVHRHRTGVKVLNHPVVGRLELEFEALDLTADSGLTLLAYSAQPGSPSQEALDLLASWALTREEEQRQERAEAAENPEHR